MSDAIASDGIVTLRRWREEDAEAVYRACQDAEIQHWLSMVPRPYLMEHALAFVRGEVEEIGQHQYAVTADDRVVGSIGMSVNRNRTGHIGYWCAPEARGRGIATRALRVLCRYGFERLGLQRLELVADPENGASQRVAAKAGFRREGVLRSHFDHPDGRRCDSVMFSLLPGELIEP